MTYDFYAEQRDIKDILEFIFSETDLYLYDMYSIPEQEVRHYTSAESVFANYTFVDCEDSMITFQLWSPRFEGDLIIEKVNLDPRRCKGKTFRYCTSGWGLIQLYFGTTRNNKLSRSHIGHQSPKRALNWQETNSKLGDVEKWNWKEVESTARKIKYHIQKRLSIKKINDYDTLKNALTLVEEQK